VITLLTDFGLRDGYVAAMKGVIASLAPEVRVVDISHEVDPGGVRRGGMVWRAALPWFPRGTVHVGVVDPGVGSARRILALEARGSIVLAPDNGLVSYALERREVRRARSVESRELFLEPVSDTFHGRDVFAPVAARLARGLELEAVGPAAGEIEWHGLPPARRRRRPAGVVEIRGEVVDTDRFGNATTNLAPPRGARLLEIEIGSRRLDRLSRSYAEAGRGSPLAIVGSLGFVEIAVSGGSAAGELGIRVGDRVTGRWAERSRAGGGGGKRRV